MPPLAQPQSLIILPLSPSIEFFVDTSMWHVWFHENCHMCSRVLHSNTHRNDLLHRNDLFVFLQFYFFFKGKEILLHLFDYLLVHLSFTLMPINPLPATQGFLMHLDICITVNLKRTFLFFSPTCPLFFLTCQGRLCPLCYANPLLALSFCRRGPSQCSRIDVFSWAQKCGSYSQVQYVCSSAFIVT